LAQGFSAHKGICSQGNFRWRVVAVRLMSIEQRIVLLIIGGWVFSEAASTDNDVCVGTSCQTPPTVEDTAFLQVDVVPVMRPGPVERSTAKHDSCSDVSAEIAQFKAKHGLGSAALSDLITPAQELHRIIAKFNRLGYPSGEIMRQTMEKIGMMSPQEIEAARWWGIKPPMQPECVAAKAAAAAYRFGQNAAAMAGHAGADDLVDEGYNFVRSFNKSEGSDWDHMDWWEKDGNCMFAFQGSDDDADFVNNKDPTPITKWGIQGIHRGIATELDGLLNQVDFAAVKTKCAGSVTVVGHSLGGGLAQLFALVINENGDPLGAQLKIDTIYTFGAMSLGEENEANDQAADGCFGGQQFFNARQDENGIAVDIVTGEKIGGQFLEPIKSSKTLLFKPGSSEIYECGKTINKSYAPSGFDLHAIQLYEYNLGCISFWELMAFLLKMGLGLAG